MEGILQEPQKLAIKNVFSWMGPSQSQLGITSIHFRNHNL